MKIELFKCNVNTIQYHINNIKVNLSHFLYLRAMTILTEREHQIMEMLNSGKQIQEIAKELNAPRSSISRSIKEIRLKLFELKNEIEFLQEIGFLQINKNNIQFLSRDMDPKALQKE